MKLQALAKKRWSDRAATAIVFVQDNGKVYDGDLLNPKAAKALYQSAKQEGFKGKLGETFLLHPSGARPARRVILAGLGSAKDLESEPHSACHALRLAAASGLKLAGKLQASRVSVLIPSVFSKWGFPELSLAVAEGLLLGSYRYDKFQSHDNGPKPEVKTASLIGSDRNGLRSAILQAETAVASANFVRDLVNEPPSRMTPSDLEKIARSLQGKGVSVTITKGLKELEKMKMEAFAGVARGSTSSQPPVFIQLAYRVPGAKRTIAFVGKGITFDSGGLSLKPSEAMETMKMDMAGAATVLSIFKALPELKPRVNVLGFAACTENMPGSFAQKPGDVVRALNGKTIEILNTDAEGRLVLADALSYASQKKPDVIIDIATLTGAVVVALGSLVAGLMGNDETLLQQLKTAGDAVGERLWPLPLVKEYKDHMKGPVADLRNISKRREAGSIIGGLFLKEFVGDGIAWAHLDVAGLAWNDHANALYPAGGTGAPARALLEYLKRQ